MAACVLQGHDIALDETGQVLYFSVSGLQLSGLRSSSWHLCVAMCTSVRACMRARASNSVPALMPPARGPQDVAADVIVSYNLATSTHQVVAGSGSGFADGTGAWHGLALRALLAVMVECGGTSQGLVCAHGTGTRVHRQECVHKPAGTSTGTARLSIPRGLHLSSDKQTLYVAVVNAIRYIGA